MVERGCHESLSMRLLDRRHNQRPFIRLRGRYLGRCRVTRDVVVPGRVGAVRRFWRHLLASRSVEIIGLPEAGPVGKVRLKQTVSPVVKAFSANCCNVLAHAGSVVSMTIEQTCDGMTAVKYCHGRERACD